MAVKVLQEIRDFIDSDSIHSLEIEFLDFDSFYSKDLKEYTLKSPKARWRVFVEKSFLFNSVTFYFIDGVNFTFSLSVSMDSFSSGNEIKVEEFIKSVQEPISGQDISINDESIILSVYITDGQGAFKGAYLQQFYFKPTKIISHETKIDVKLLSTRPTIQSRPTQTGGKEGCYIATLVYGDYDHPQVMVLRQFRDETLQSYFLGKIFIRVYYVLSPFVVKILRPFSHVHQLIRKILNFIIKHLNQ